MSEKIREQYMLRSRFTSRFVPTGEQKLVSRRLPNVILILKSFYDK
jgi:hypothetical protein